MASIIGTFGDDNLGGTPGDDIIVGGGGSDLIVGLAGNDILSGDAGNDVLLAGEGDDVLVGIGGRDGLHGGSGFDIVSFADTGATMVTVNLIDGVAADNAGGSYTLAEIEGVTGTNGADVLIGSSGKNFFMGRGGADIIEGKEGLDFAAYQSFRAAYSISDSGISKLVSDLVPGRDGTDLVTKVERFSFSDGVLAFDNLRADNAGRGYLLYRAAFDRTPDIAGLGYWIREIDNGSEYGSVVAASFIASAEFTGKYGANTSNAAFLDLIYQNVLDRAPDAAGRSYWLGQLDQGYARSNLLASFAISDENYNHVAPLIANGIWYGLV